jgi:hypothetical protein
MITHGPLMGMEKASRKMGRPMAGRFWENSVLWFI